MQDITSYSIENSQDEEELSTRESSKNHSEKDSSEKQKSPGSNDISGNIIVEFKNADIERAERLVLKHINFKLHEGEFCYLVGRVGSGKSSLMKAIYADVPVNTADSVNVLDYDLLHLKRSRKPYLRREIGIVFQDFQLLQDRSVAANLRFVLQATGWKKKTEIEERIEKVLKEVGMENKSYKMPHELSGGEQQRIVIARALLNNPKLIIADEPTGNLDPQTGYQIVSLLHKLADAGHAVLMATHNMQLVEEFPARTIRCVDKGLVEN